LHRFMLRFLVAHQRAISPTLLALWFNGRRSIRD
jgi:hypothetical protein